MNDPLPPEIEVLESLDLVRYRLPRRQLGPFRWLGLFPLLVGLVFAGFAGSIMAAAVATLPWGQNQVMEWAVRLGFAAFCLPFIVAGLWAVRLGVLVLGGHTEVDLIGDRLQVRECCGPVRWRRRFPLAGLRRFVVYRGNADGPSPAVLRDLAALGAEYADGRKPAPVVLGYPAGWLRALADDLARRCNLSGAAGELAAVQVGEEAVALAAGTKPDTFTERTEQPAGSRVRLEEHADGVTLTVPPRGVLFGSRGLFAFSLIWLLIVSAVTAGFAAGVVHGERDAWFALLFLGLLFWPVGIGMLLAAVNMGRRQAVLAVVGDTLLVMQTGLFGSKRREWPRGQLRDIRPGPSGLEVNKVPVLELQILPTEGKKFGLLAGQEDADLAWMATVLRRSLRLRTDPPPPSPPPADETSSPLTVPD